MLKQGANKPSFAGLHDVKQGSERETNCIVENMSCVRAVCGSESNHFQWKPQRNPTLCPLHSSVAGSCATVCVVNLAVSMGWMKPSSMISHWDDL